MSILHIWRQCKIYTLYPTDLTLKIFRKNIVPVIILGLSLICHNGVTTQNCDFSGEMFKGFEVL